MMARELYRQKAAATMLCGGRPSSQLWQRRLSRPDFHRDRGSADAEQSGCDPEVRSNF